MAYVKQVYKAKSVFAVSTTTVSKNAVNVHDISQWTAAHKACNLQA
jgi:hypothetical protein